MRQSLSRAAFPPFFAGPDAPGSITHLAHRGPFTVFFLFVPPSVIRFRSPFSAVLGLFFPLNFDDVFLVLVLACLHPLLSFFLRIQ